MKQFNKNLAKLQILGKMCAIVARFIVQKLWCVLYASTTKYVIF